MGKIPVLVLGLMDSHTRPQILLGATMKVRGTGSRYRDQREGGSPVKGRDRYKRRTRRSNHLPRADR